MGVVWQVVPVFVAVVVGVGRGAVVVFVASLAGRRGCGGGRSCCMIYISLHSVVMAMFLWGGRGLVHVLLGCILVGWKGPCAGLALLEGKD